MESDICNFCYDAGANEKYFLVEKLINKHPNSGDVSGYSHYLKVVNWSKVRRNA